MTKIMTCSNSGPKEILYIEYFGKTFGKEESCFIDTRLLSAIVESDVSLNGFIVGSLTFLYSDVFSINALTVCLVWLFTLDIRHLLSFYSID